MWSVETNCRAVVVGLLLLACVVQGASAATEIEGWGDTWNLEYGSDTEYSGGVPPIYDAIALDGGRYHALALRSDGTVFCWGNNDSGQCGAPEGLSDVVDVVAGEDASFALRSDGTVVCWGDGIYGAVSTLESLYNVIAVAAGGVHALALLEDGTIVAGGWDSDGQCTVPSGIQGQVVGIAAGYWHSCALLENGTVVCWGYNGDGQCSVPDGLSDVVGIACGDHHTVALKSDGTVVCWGWNDYGQCDVPWGLGDVVDIDGGEYHTVALKSDGTVACWGDDSSGQCSGSEGLNDAFYIAAASGYTLSIDPLSPPTAAFSYSSNYGEAPFTVQFTDTSTVEGNAAYVSYLWDFGDGWASTVQNPVRTFASPDTYTVTLEVTNGAGSDQISHEIEAIEPHVYSEFSGTPTTGSAPLTVQFTGVSSETATSWFWEFGDGFTSRAQNPAHTYIVAGTYTVAFTSYNVYGSDTDTKTNYITVSPGAVSSATICGIVHDLSSFATIDAATVTITNASGWSSTAVSASGGYYEFETLTPGAYTVQATKPGYAASTTYAVQAYAASVSKQDIALTVSGVSLTGTCYDAVTGTALEGATVTATQGTATVSNTTGTAGTYLMDTFTTSSSITLSAAATGYTHTAISVTPTGDGPITRNLYLIPASVSYTGQAIAGLVTSTRDDQAVQGATVTATASSGGSTGTALTNPTGFYLIDNLAAGQWGVKATATSYTTSQTYTHTLENGTLTLQDIRLEPESQASSVSYTPKQVRFTYLSSTGVPLAGLSVSAVGSTTTALSWDWFLSLLGLDVEDTHIATSVMSGITGSDGSIAFMMLESVYYTINASNPDLGLSISANIYPKEDQYVFTVLGDTPSSASRVTWDLTASEADETHTALALSYLDRGNRTQTLTFNVYDESRTLVHSETVANANEVSVSYTTANEPGAVMYWGFSATRITTGTETETIQDDQYIRFSGDGDGGLFSFGLPQVLRHWIGFLFLVCMGLLLGTMFGPGALKFAGPAIGIFALTLKFMDWLPIGWEIAITIFVIGCLGYLRTAKDERMV